MGERNGKASAKLETLDSTLEFIAALQDCVARLEKESQQLKEQSQAYEIELGHTRRDIARLQEERQGFDAILAQREEAQRGLESKIAAESVRLNELSVSIAGHIHRASEAEKEAGRVKGEYASLQEAMTRESEAREKAHEDARTLKNAADDLERRFAESVQAAASKDGEIQNLRTEIGIYRTEATHYQETARELRVRADTAEQRLDTLQLKLGELGRLQTDTEQYHARINLLEKELAEQARALELAREETTKYKTDYEESQRMRNGVESMAREFARKVKAQEADIVLRNGTIKKYEEAVAAQEQSIRQLRADWKKANDSLDTVMRHNGSLEVALRKAEEECAHYKNKLDNFDRTVRQIMDKARTPKSGGYEMQHSGEP